MFQFWLTGTEVNRVVVLTAYKVSSFCPPCFPHFYALRPRYLVLKYFYGFAKHHDTSQLFPLLDLAVVYV